MILNVFLLVIDQVYQKFYELSFFSEIRMAHNPSSFHQGAHPHYHRPNMRQPPGKVKLLFLFHST